MNANKQNTYGTCMDGKQPDKIVFWCDGQGCERARERGGCPNEDCYHTSDPSHAKHFTKMNGVWFEDEPPEF